MSFPLYQHDIFGYPVGMALAVAIGFGFGLALERAGFGKASNLVAQFYGDDMRVLKVMFTAIVTNMVGLGILGGLGVVELEALKIPVTYLWPQLAGGLLLGAGFVVSGYCPGTAFVGAGTGNVDAIYTLVGVVVGSLLFGFAWPVVENLYVAGEMGPVTFVDLLGVPWPVLATGVVVMAVGAFLGGEWFERWLAARNGAEAPTSEPPVRNAIFVAMAVAAAVGLATLALPAKVEADATTPVGRIDATELALQVVEHPQGLWLVDLRPAEACEAKRIPGALCVPAEDPDATFLATLPATRRLVLYGASELDDVPASVHAYAGAVAVLDGGWAAFEEAVLSNPTPPENPTTEAVARYELLAALHGHFTGVKVERSPVRAAPKAVSRAAKKGGGC